MKPEPPRLTAIDRFLHWERQHDRALELPDRPRRRTHRRAGKLDVVIVEEQDRPTRVLLSEAEDVHRGAPILEMTVAELRQALAHAEEAMARPPPRGKRGP